MIITKKENYTLRTWEASDAESLAVQLNNKKIWDNCWNQGIVTDALKEAIRYYFQHTPIIRVFAFVFEYNLPSMRVLEKVGFTKIGVMHKSIYKNGAFCDAHYFEMLKEE